MDVAGPGDMDVTKPCKFMWFRDVRNRNPYEITRSRATIVSYTPVVGRCPASLGLPEGGRVLR